MSKAIDTLRRFPFDKDDILHDHIANTYFNQKSRKKPQKPQPKNIKINFALASFFAVAISIMAVYQPLYHHYINTLREKINNTKEIKIVDSGRLNGLPIKKVAFRGYAKNRSAFPGDSLIIANARKYNWAEMSCDFRFPVDLSNRNILLSVKGKIGGERLGIVLRDANNRSSKLDDIYLIPDWSTHRIPLSAIKKDLDLSSITHLRLECGYVGESSKEADLPIEVTIYVKNFQIVKED